MTSFQTGNVDLSEPPSTELLGLEVKLSIHGSDGTAVRLCSVSSVTIAISRKKSYSQYTACGL